MKVIRWLLGRIILTLDFLTTPKGIKRADEEQLSVNTATGKLALYQFAACPFCVKVRRSMKRLSLDIELRDAKKDQQHRAELAEQGGRIKTPCLRIEKADGEVTWMYESKDIISYLEQNFTPKIA
ncbi:MAG: glutathione S-transferase N-terminal domain-containing protein [Oceanospirillaceae bacterium]|nr:glutathione S-transferase N-terminal domain-containing protein [Oceanospirillaceae bacterium]